MPRGTASALSMGPGYLYIADLGTTEPTDLTTPWATVDAGWLALGYTKEGSSFKSSTTVEPVEVAEELDPAAYETTGRTGSVSFMLAEITATNLMRALNASTSDITAGAGIVTFEPPDLGSEVRRMIGFESEDNQERWVWRQCFQAGDVQIDRQKGAANATIPCEFNLEKPATGAKLWKAIMVSPGRA